MITTDHPALIKCNPDSVLWRYMSLFKFDSLLKEKSIFLCRSDKFIDPYEGAIPRRESEYRVKENMRVAEFFNRPMSEGEARMKSNEMADFHKRFRKSYVVNCWHISNCESDAMWRLYLENNEGVAIQSSYKKLFESIKHNSDDVMISKVRYVDYDKDVWHHKDEYPISSYNLISPIVHKRIEFKHENELRIFQLIGDASDSDNYWEDKPSKMGISISCDTDLLIDKIILSPFSGEHVKGKVEEIMEKHLCYAEVVNSKLSYPPTY